jgi:hypothetical protein
VVGVLSQKGLVCRVARHWWVYLDVKVMEGVGEGRKEVVKKSGGNSVTEKKKGCEQKNQRRMKNRS